MKLYLWKVDLFRAGERGEELEGETDGRRGRTRKDVWRRRLVWEMRIVDAQRITQNQRFVDHTWFVLHIWNWHTNIIFLRFSNLPLVWHLGHYKRNCPVHHLPQAGGSQSHLFMVWFAVHIKEGICWFGIRLKFSSVQVNHNTSRKLTIFLLASMVTLKPFSANLLQFPSSPLSEYREAVIFAKADVNFWYLLQLRKEEITDLFACLYSLETSHGNIKECGRSAWLLQLFCSHLLWWSHI